MRFEAKLGGLTFVGGDGEATYTIQDDGLSGWFDAPGVRSERAVVPAGDGEFDAPTFMEARLIELRGLVFADSVFGYEQAVRDLMRAGSSRSRTRFSVMSPAGSQWAWVRPADDARVTPLVYGRVAEYRLTLKAADPRKFGDVRSYGAGEAAVNYGNFEAVPVVNVRRVSGSGGYSVTAGSGLIEVSANLSVGGSHRIDLRTGGLFQGSTRLTGAMPTFRPWVIPADGSLTHSASAGVELTVDVTDTYM